ncbi:hypothetical protein BN2476_240026 [Paraburkholderia piptadeniae]|uniref:NIL domain-containing protein n=1 Tax=Paraburkholderia piptadeniae TaxID=1701573 RepID=A0A1N7RZL9_9BURK|nr:hypothetical protein BN2476_240026 [Paraburkholderia piptadeniae]
MHSRSSTECKISFLLPASPTDRSVIAALELVADSFGVDVMWSGLEGRRAICVVSYEIVEAFVNALIDALHFACRPGRQEPGLFCADETKPPRPRR